MSGGDEAGRIRPLDKKADAHAAPGGIGSLEGLGDVYLASDDWKQALLRYEEASRSPLWDASSRADKARLAIKMVRAHIGLGDLESALRLVSQAERLAAPSEDLLLIGKIHALSGQVHRRAGDNREALAFSLRALDALRRTDEHGEIASVQLTCGSIFLRLGNLSEAIRYFQDSLSTYRRIEDQAGIAKAYNNLGVAYKDLCQWENAAHSLRKAMEIDRRFGNYAGVALRMLNLGLIQYQRGDWQGSRRRTEKSLQMSRAVNDSMGVTLCSLALARIARHERRWGEARGRVLEALRLARGHGNRRELSAAYEEIGAWHFDRGKYGIARAFFERSLAIAERIAEKSDHVAEVHRRLSETAAATGRPAEAEEFARRALRAAAQIRNRRLIAIGLRALAAAERLLGNPKRAAFFATRSVRLLETLGVPFDLGRSLTESARIARENDDLGAARSELARAEAIFRGLGLEPQAARVLLESARLKIRTDRLEDAVVLLRKAERLLGKDPGGPDAEEVRSLRRTIEERFAEGSLSPVNNRFLAFRESIRDGSSPLPRLVRELGADRAFIFHRVQAGESVVGECHLFSPLDAVRVLRSLDARIAASGGLRPFVSVGGGSGGTRAFLVAPFGDGEAGVYVERKLDPATRPFARSDLDFLVGVGCEVDSLARSQGARAPIAGRDGAFEGVVTRNKRMIEILAMLRRLGGVHTTVLLQGETGTGKGLLASEISRADAAPFVTINCADLTETILESELFGHAKNAFTGAGSGKKGLFEVANGGTVFIDEIDKTSRKFQEKLLRVVDRREFKPVGSVDLKRVECRIVCASNRDLRAEVDAGRFLEDLYYRLKVISIQIPPLRERPEDIPLLADHFLKKSSRAMRREGVAFAPEVVRLFTRYTWPGNVRDIQNEVERAVALASDGETIGVSSLSDELVAFERSGVPPRADGEGTLAHMVEGLEERAIRDALLRFAGNKSRAARSLGLTRKGLRNKILRYGIDS